MSLSLTLHSTSSFKSNQKLNRAVGLKCLMNLERERGRERGREREEEEREGERGGEREREGERGE